MFAELASVEERLQELHDLLATPEVATHPARIVEYSREVRRIEPVVDAYRALRQVQQGIEETREMTYAERDPDMQALARDELEELLERETELIEKLQLLLLPRDPNDDKNILLEIRAGTGGEESALFAADLFRMYARFAETRRWKLKVMSSHPTPGGGFKEIICGIEGDAVYSFLKYEAGVHRVQRVPETESQGRIHTSAVTVAVLPEAEEVEVQLEEKDLRFDVFRASGPGGQSVNTTDSAVRITHLPTGLVVTCQDEKSQHKNKAQALKVLRARLFELKRQEQADDERNKRKAMVGTGDRSEKVRTYNFPQNRITDHRIGLTLHRLEFVLGGDLEELMGALQAHFQAEALKQSAVIERGSGAG